MFTLPDLPYDYTALEPYIDEQTMRIHHDKHHATYVDKLNTVLTGQEKLTNITIEEIMQNLGKVPEPVRTAVRNNGGGHVNHSLFWQIMAPVKNEEPETVLITAINNTFGSLMKLKAVFSQAALNRFGSGWVWLAVNHGQLEVMDTANQDTPLMEWKIPILTIDVWEHAYYLKYQNRRADYINSWWNVVAWTEVSRRFKEAIKI